MMFGAQQISAYKAIMKTPQHLPQHSQSAVRLFRLIAWGAVIMLAVFVAAIIAASIADLAYAATPVFLAVIPMALVLLCCWWLIDVIPKVSRWLIASIALASAIGCLVFVWVLPTAEKIQLVALMAYLLYVFREASRQIWHGFEVEDELEDA